MPGHVFSPTAIRPHTFSCDEAFWHTMLAKEPAGTRTDYRRFIILGSPRTGSNYLLTLLRSHPNIYARGELFNRLCVFDYENHPLHAELLRRRQADPENFLRRFCFFPLQASMDASGFKLFYQHVDGPLRWFPFILRQEPDIRIIHLKRRNVLRQYYSYQRAMLDDRWWTVAQETPSTCITIDPDACLRFFASTVTLRNRFDAIFRDVQLEVWYEDLIADKEGVMRKVQEFLGVPVRTLQSNLKKQNPFPLRECITNHNEVRARLLGTEWEPFLEEQPRPSANVPSVRQPPASHSNVPSLSVSPPSREEEELYEQHWQSFLKEQQRGSRTDYQRFVLLGGPRTGSNYVLTLLASHPNIRMLGELFHNRSLVFDFKNHPLHAGIVHCRNTNPLNFIKQLVFPPLPESIEASGFKLFYEHIEEVMKALPFYLRQEPQFRVIHLKRRNALRSYYSLQRALCDRNWRSTDTNPPAPPRIILDVAGCMYYLRRLDAFHDQYDAIFRDIQLEVWYEDLLEDRENIMRKIQEFLGVTVTSLHSNLKKQNVAPLPECIANYSELCTRLRGTKWEHQLEEEATSFPPST